MSKNRKLYHKNIETITALFIFFSLAAYIFFFELDNPTVRMWDEARRAVTALEMLQNGNWLVLHFDGEPDMVGTKPPLLIWCIALSMKLFGYNAFALRLPSAISGFVTTVLLLCFGKFYLRDTKIGLIGGFTLLTTPGFVGEHVARTGDFDAMLILWVVLYSFLLFMYIENQNPYNKKLLILGVTIFSTFAVLTKGIAAFLILPGIFSYCVVEKKITRLLKSPQVITSIIFIAVTSVGYYVLRNAYNPGYIEAIINNELVGRYINGVDGGVHNQPVNFYIYQISEKFKPWIYLLPLSFLLSQKSSSEARKKFGRYSFWICLLYMIVISVSKTKLPWYDAQFYPFASMIIGIGINELLIYIERNKIFFEVRFISRKLISYGLIAVLFFQPLLYTSNNFIRKNHGILYDWSSKDQPELRYGQYLQHISSDYIQSDSLAVVSGEAYNAHLLFYVKVHNLQSLNKIKIEALNSNFMPNDRIITCSNEVKQALRSKYYLKVLDRSEFCSTLEIISRKVSQHDNHL